MLGENIWIRRQLLGMSKDDLAKAYGCGVSMVSCWERGANVPGRIKDLSRLLNCSIHELHRQYQMPKLSFVETGRVIEKKEEPAMSDEEIVKAASVVFKNAYVRPAAEPEPEVHPVVDRLNKYKQEHNIGDYKMSKLSGLSAGTIYRMKNGLLSYNNKFHKRMEEFLDRVENTTDEVSTVKEAPQVKGSIASRFNSIYNTLFKALEDLDELKADIDKINKATALLKDI